MAVVEYKCKKCGTTFIDDENTTTHFLLMDEDGNELGECGGEGEVQFVFTEGFTNRGSH